MSVGPVGRVSFPTAYGVKDKEGISSPGVFKQSGSRPAEGRECRTCAARRYIDASGDPAVSMKSPTRLPVGAEAAAVLAHEYEHLAHDREKAEREGRRVVFQTVQIFTAVCPECGRVYVSGGRAITVSQPRSFSEKIKPGEMGRGLDVYKWWSEWQKAKEQPYPLGMKDTYLALDRVV